MALGFDVECICVLNLQDMLSYLYLFLPYLILISLAWNLRREYLGLILVLGFARLVLRIVVAWGLFVLLGFVVLVVPVVLHMGRGQKGTWSVEHLVVVVVLLF